VDGNSHSLMVVMHPADELRQMGLHFSQRQCRHSQKFDQNIGKSQTPDGVYRVACRLTADQSGMAEARITTERDGSLMALPRLGGTGLELGFRVGAGEGIEPS
jgi:hypothetical protein